MKQTSRILIVFMLVGIFAVMGYANSANKGDDPSISISPSTLVLKAPVKCVSVHSNLPYSLVDASSVTLEGVAPYLVTADDLGDMVAKFDVDAIAEVVEAGEQILTMTCIFDGVEISVSDGIRVK